MQAANTFGRITMYGTVQRFSKYCPLVYVKHQKPARAGNAIPVRDYYKSLLHMNEKGKPPFLSSPLVPMNMIPYNAGSDWIFQRNQYNKILFKQHQLTADNFKPREEQDLINETRCSLKAKQSLATLNAIFDHFEEKQRIVNSINGLIRRFKYSSYLILQSAINIELMLRIKPATPPPSPPSEPEPEFAVKPTPMVDDFLCFQDYEEMLSEK